MSVYDAPPRPPIPYFGEISALGAAVSWAISIAIYRAWAGRISAVTLNLIKSMVAAVGLVMAVAALHPPLPASGSVITALMVSGILGIAVSDTLVLAGLTRVGVTLTAASFCFAAPMAALLALWLFHETLSPLELLGIALSIGATLGVVIFHRDPTLADESRGRGWRAGIAALFFGQIANAVGIVLGHGALEQADVLHGTLLRLVPAIFFLIPLFGWQTRCQQAIAGRLSGKEVSMVLLGCIIGSLVGLILMSLGLKYARAGIAAALNSTYPIWTIPISHFFLKERVGWLCTGFTFLAVGGIVLLFVF